MTTAITFDTLLDTSLSDVSSIEELKAAVNKRMLSLVNDYEDGQWRYSRFQSYLWDNIAQTALSQRERDALVGKSHTTLVASAKNLRLTDNDKVGQGSEIAEVFLYGIMKDHFGALPVVPKIFYKQNAQDNAKGADSVHIVIKDNEFSLWFGEAKFYNSLADSRLDKIVLSVIESLRTDKLKKENSIVTNVSDIYHLDIDNDLRTKIIEAIQPKESIDTLKNKINVPIMLLYECQLTSTASIFDDAYRESLIADQKNRAESYFKKQISASSAVFMYEEIKFHVIFFPVPNKEKIVKSFVNGVSFFKAQS
ncbi:HamA C-terminal domain-containing protein [Mesorhizobium huakuii]|uniref:DUF1837 domain-containing protein n=1 Tax=Mesorhizobium huakuii TaxID=28104 RepID=A0A7G6SQ14_9HYPH|nr:DUF1837 domain-containing protein [Mesorhizobium huakuii]QND56596.1 DUF1837 domain-containing protein [Mesorhizobium huakuii]